MRRHHIYDLLPGWEKAVHEGGRTCFEGVWNYQEAHEGQITYMMEEGITGAGAVVTDSVAKVHPADPSINPTLIIVDRPRRTIAKIAQHFVEPRSVWYEEDLPGVLVFMPVEIGENLKCAPGTVIGSDGFGYERDYDGYFLMPHLGSVIIGDNVEVGANTVIDRGTFSHTRIGSGTKIDNLVHVAHNCQIGENVMIVAGTSLGGSVTIEDDVWLGINSTVMQGVTIGKRATIGIGAVVLRDVEPGQTIVGHHRVIESKEEQRGVIR